MSAWLRASLWVIGSTAIVAMLLWFYQRRLIYHPAGLVAPVEQVLPGWHDEVVTTEDGEHLGVWHTGPVDGAPIVIVFNGIAGTRAGRATLGEALAGHGFGVILFDYRGYGDSTGTPSEDGLAMDAAAVGRLAGEIAPHSPVVYFGESLGAAVAIGLAVKEPPDALILRSPFTSLADVARFHYRIPVDPLLRDRYASETVIAGVDTPTLVIAGSADGVVPPSQSRRIHGAATGPKELLVVDDADHNDLALLAGEQMLDAVDRFIRRHAGR